MRNHEDIQEPKKAYSYSKHLQRQTYGDHEHREIDDRTRKGPSIGWHLHCVRNLVCDVMYDTVVSVADYS